MTRMNPEIHPAVNGQDHGKEKLGAVIMASGFSRRMEANKLLLTVKGEPLIARVMDRALAVGFLDITVVTAYDEIAALAREKGIQVIKNHCPQLGQSRSVVLGTRANLNARGIMYIPGDMPFLTETLLKELGAAFEKNPDCIVRPVYGDDARPGGPVIFPRTLFGELCKLEGDCGGREIMARHPELVKTVFVENWQAGVDIDTPEDAVRWLLGAEGCRKTPKGEECNEDK